MSAEDAIHASAVIDALPTHFEFRAVGALILSTAGSVNVGMFEQV